MSQLHRAARVPRGSGVTLAGHTRDGYRVTVLVTPDRVTSPEYLAVRVSHHGRALERARVGIGPHSFTSPSLGVNETIPGGGTMAVPRTVTFTFTAPAKAGKCQWWCSVPCDPWSMAHNGFMRGFVTVTA